MCHAQSTADARRLKTCLRVYDLVARCSTARASASPPAAWAKPHTVPRPSSFAEKFIHSIQELHFFLFRRLSCRWATPGLVRGMQPETNLRRRPSQDCKPQFFCRTAPKGVLLGDDGSLRRQFLNSKQNGMEVKTRLKKARKDSLFGSLACRSRAPGGQRCAYAETTGGRLVELKSGLAQGSVQFSPRPKCGTGSGLPPTQSLLPAGLDPSQRLCPGKGSSDWLPTRVLLADVGRAAMRKGASERQMPLQ